MKILFFTKPKLHTLNCVKFFVEAGAEICGIVIYNKYNYQNTEFCKYCQNKNIIIYEGEHIDDYIKDFKGNLDVIFCNTYPKLIKKELLESAKLGGYNFHMAPLPDYKGVFGFNFAIYNEEKKYGVTCHRLADGFDNGDVVEVQYFDIEPKKITVKELVKESEEQTLLLIKKIYYLLEKGVELKSRPQTGGAYYSRKKFDELKRISDTDSQEEIERKIRAFWYPPYEGAYIVINDIKYTLVDDKTLLRMMKIENEK